MNLNLAIICRRIVFRALLLVFLGLAAVLSQGTAAQATTFQPSWSVSLTDDDPGAASSITLRLNIPSPDANFGQLLNFIPPGFSVTPGEEVPNGAIAGLVNSNATLGLVNAACSSALSPSFEMLEASVDVEQTVPIYVGIYDYNGNGLPDNVDYYPTFLGTYAPQIQPRLRLYGQTVVAGVIVPLNFVIFEPGASLPLFPALDPSLGYPTVVIIGDPIEPIQPVAITDFCTPLETATTLRGVSQDNPLTAVNEGGVLVRRNPDVAGAANAAIFARSRADADADGIENELDPCPASADPVWDPRSAHNSAGDADADGLPDSCDPNDSETNSDQDGDGFMNRQDPCPRIAESYPFDSDRDGVGDSCDPVPDDATDGGASHRHQVCAVDTLVVGAPSSTDPTPFVCPDGPDLPIPPVMYVYPEESVQLVGSVHSIETSIYHPLNAGPAVGNVVQFSVSGANPGSGSCLTNNFGGCEFNYQGLNAGLDTIVIEASVDGTDLSREVTNEWVEPPANDAFADAEVIAQIPFEDEVPLMAADNEPDEPSDCFVMGRTVWYRFTPGEAAFVTIEAAAKSSPLVLAVYTGSALTDLDLIGCDTGVFGPKLFPAEGFPAGSEEYYFENYVSFAAEAGVTYQVEVGLLDPLYFYPELVEVSIDYATPGDANCSADLTALDALQVLRFVAGMPAADCAANGDINCDGDLSAVDALMILRVVASIIQQPEACPVAAET